MKRSAYIMGILMVLIPLVVMGTYYGQDLGPKDSPTFTSLTLTNTDLNNYDKYGYFFVPHYNSASEPSFVVFGGYSFNTPAPQNDIYFGGGDGYHNSATRIYFWTGADATTLSGTSRMMIDSDSVDLAVSMAIADGLHISTDEIRARDSDGLKLYDDSGNGIFVADGGTVEINQNSVQPFTSVASGAVDNTLYLKNGNVGIGTTVPSSILDIQSNISSALRVQGGLPHDTYYLDLASYIDGGLVGYKFTLKNSGTTYTDLLALNGGNVGIGTMSPGYKLEVNGGTQNPKIAVLSTGNYQDFFYGKTNATNNIRVYTFGRRADTYFGNADGAAVFVGDYFGPSAHDHYIAPIILNPNGDVILAGASANATNGNVGIGTTTPGYELEVSGDGYFSGDVSALTFTDRTPYFEGDALAAIKSISGKDGQIDHSTLPEFARRSLQRKETETVLGERVPVKPEDVWEEYTETETVYDTDAKGEKIILGTKTVYREKDGTIVSEQQPIYKSSEVKITKKRLKDGVKLDPDTGELYTQESTQVEHVISEEPGRDLGAMVSILTRAVQQLTAKVEALEGVK